VRNLVYPSEFSDDGSGLAFPIATLTRNVATTTEVDTILDTDGNVDLSFALERTIARVRDDAVLTGGRSHFDGRVRVATVKNTLRDVRVSENVRPLGDIELHHAPPKGVFYGFVDEAVAGNPRWGAERTAPEPEVTAPWSAHQTGADPGPSASWGRAG